MRAFLYVLVFVAWVVACVCKRERLFVCVRVRLCECLLLCPC